MSKIKRPSFKYKIEKISTTNVHSDVNVYEKFFVYVKDNNSFLSQWMFIDYQFDMNNDFALLNGYIGRCNSLDECKHRLDFFIKKQRDMFEQLTCETTSVVDKGIINI